MAEVKRSLIEIKKEKDDDDDEEESGDAETNPETIGEFCRSKWVKKLKKKRKKLIMSIFEQILLIADSWKNGVFDH